MEGILNLENWRKFGNDWVGYYIYPIASKVAYETKWLINNICYYLHINKNKNIHLRIYK